MGLSLSSREIAVMGSRVMFKKQDLTDNEEQYLADYRPIRPDQRFARGVGGMGLTRSAVPSDRMGWRSTNAVIRGGIEEVACGLADDEREDLGVQAC